MKIVDTIKNLFRKGGVKVGLVSSLGRVIDHPKIAMSQEEYDRIQLDWKYFSGHFKDVEYLNSDKITKRREYVSLNMLQVASKRMASLVFNEQCKINVGEDKKLKEFIDDVLTNNDFKKNFESYLESMFGLGGLAIRPYFDLTTGKIKLSWAQAPSVFPLQSNSNNISDFAIANYSQKAVGNHIVYYTLLEFHEWKGDQYTIKNELYRSEMKSQVGMKVPLNELYMDMPDVSIFKDGEFSRPLVTYLKPAGFNNRDITSPLGLSIGSNARATLKQINDANDQFFWEIKMGQRRVAVSESMVKLLPDLETGMTKPLFDSDQNIFMAFNDGIGENGIGIQDLTTPIRADDYIKTINNLIKRFEMQAGFSSGTFSFDGAQGVKTATEIVSENSMTYQTRNSQISQIERAIQELVVTICELGKLNNVFTGEIPKIADITVDFDDGVFTDKQAQLAYWTQRISAGLATTWQALMAIDGLDEDSAKALANEINGDTVDETPQTEEDETPEEDITKKGE